ncbi:thiopeptide-type bacteriocin biosynthesis protein [Actinacidiphila acididurans]|uniref:thiopeptide-type bacteriocin biosynthesis protein n=1 Tax=Actinacidiphila acididurans TaxID=2784346 RepID=UPI001F213E7C|nr:thiopeptide-type bacteriocin biosynthesis protein [Actinacidiphila acididurans]
MPFASDQRPVPAPARRSTVVAGRAAGRLPGASDRAYLKLYGSTARVPEVLTAHLPRLLADWDADPAAWFTRYADPESHLRLRLRLPVPEAFGAAAQKVAAWASELREEGLIQRVQWDTDLPETGRYGTGPVLEAAEAFFAADSAAALAQMRLDRVHQQVAVIAASYVDIAVGLLGSRRGGLDWLVEHLPRNDGQAPPRPVQALALRLAGPDGAQSLADPAVAQAWELRRTALDRYRGALESAGIDPADVLPSLLHMHHNRVAGIDPDAETTCRRLARAAALSWSVRPEGALR